VKTPATIAPEALDFTRLIRAGETIAWAEATAEPVFLTRLLDAQAERCPPFRVFFTLTFSDGFAADHPNVTVIALGGASAGRRFFASRADNVMPANTSAKPSRMRAIPVVASPFWAPAQPWRIRPTAAHWASRRTQSEISKLRDCTLDRHGARSGV
jgi:hypothetical protein